MERNEGGKEREGQKKHEKESEKKDFHYKSQRAHRAQLSELVATNPPCPAAKHLPTGTRARSKKALQVTVLFPGHWASENEKWPFYSVCPLSNRKLTKGIFYSY